MEALIECVMLMMKVLLKYYKDGNMDKEVVFENINLKIKFLEENFLQLQSFEKRIEAKNLINEYKSIFND